MRISTFILVIGLGVAAGVAYWVMDGRLDDARNRVLELEGQVTFQTEELLGRTKYKDYLTAGKRSLAEQTKLLTATLVREEGVTRVIEKSILGLPSKAVVAIWYAAEYSFGFDLRSESYDLRATDTGIEVKINKPIIVATPSVSNLRYEILTKGVFTDEKAAVIKLYAEASRNAKEHGPAMASEAAILALCEKRLISFLHDFLAKQPGVKAVPSIVVTYKN